MENNLENKKIKVNIYTLNSFKYDGNGPYITGTAEDGSTTSLYIPTKYIYIKNNKIHIQISTIYWFKSFVRDTKPGYKYVLPRPIKFSEITKDEVDYELKNNPYSYSKVINLKSPD